MASATPPQIPADADRAARWRADAFAAKRVWHRVESGRTPREKVERLLRLQREILPILRTRRDLLPHEQPWPILP